MSFVVRGVVRQCAERKRIFGQVLRIAQQRLDEIAAEHVMREIAEEWAAVRVVAHVLNNCAPVGISLSPAQVLLRGLRISFQKQRLDVRLPGGVHDGLMGKYGIREGGWGPR